MLHPDATTVRLVHQHMIEEELARHRKPDRDGRSDHEPLRPTITLRRVAARALRAVASRIEPQPRVDRSLPPTKPAV